MPSDDLRLHLPMLGCSSRISMASKRSSLLKAAASLRRPAGAGMSRPPPFYKINWQQIIGAAAMSDKDWMRSWV